MSLGINVKKLRKKLNLTQEELGNKIGVKAITIRKYESDERQPNIETLKKIATALGVSVDTLTCNESFAYEIFSRAMQLSLKNLPPDCNDEFTILSHYADYNTLIKFYNKVQNDLSLDCIKGLFNYIIDTSKEEFNKIYNDLISTDIYNLDSEFEDYCQQLYLKINSPLEFISDQDKDILKYLDYFKDGRLSFPDDAVKLFDDILMTNTNSAINNTLPTNNNLNNVTYTKDLCYKLGLSDNEIGNFVDLDSTLSIKQLQLICQYLKLKPEEEAFLYSNLIYKTDNDIFKIIAFYRYLRVEYSLELVDVNTQYFEVGSEIAKKFNLSLNLGYALNYNNKRYVSRIMFNEDKYKKIITDILDLSNTSSIFPLDELSLENYYTIFNKLSETLDFELYKLNREFSKIHN